MTEELVELLVEVVGLPVQVGRFRRVGASDLELAEPIEWLADADGHNVGVWAGPADGAWRFDDVLQGIASWNAGDTVVLNQLILRQVGEKLDFLGFQVPL
jgi:hypothetical protein